MKSYCFRNDLWVTGEVVPDVGAPLPVSVGISKQVSDSIQVTIRGEIGRSYATSISTNLLHWDRWTNQFNATGTLFIIDETATNDPMRFYRGVLVP
jgi:hypothetical protein